jgi:hypothetical protein
VWAATMRNGPEQLPELPGYRDGVFRIVVVLSQNGPTSSTRTASWIRRRHGVRRSR